MALVTRLALSFFDDGKRIDVPAGSPARLIENIGLALAGDDHLQGLVAGAVKTGQAAGQSPIVVSIRGRVRVVPKAMLVEVSANGR